MKKLKVLLTVFTLLVACSLCASAADTEPSPDAIVETPVAEDVVPEEVPIEGEPIVPEAPTGFTIVVNGVKLESPTIIRNNVHYVPVRPVFEKLGAQVFYRQRDKQIYALSRDGDTLQHIVGSSDVHMNGVKKTFRYPSFMECGVTYIPIEMIATLFRTNDIFHDHDKKELIINKPFANTAHTKLVADVLGVCRSANFYPEKFKRYINYHSKKPAASIADVVYVVNLDLDFPFYENVTTISNPYSLLVLVNKHNKLPAGFTQKNLVTMDKKYTISDGKQYLMVNVAYENFARMSDAAKAQGLSIRALSTYRTENYQKNLYNTKLRTTGQRNADNYSARPGYSEHQTGLAVDINSTGTSFERTAEFKWLQAHAHEYGYILRYPKDKSWITGYAYEPWHYRYVGPTAAAIIHKEGSTYEQYYAKYIAVNEFK